MRKRQFSLRGLRLPLMVMAIVAVLAGGAKAQKENDNWRFHDKKRVVYSGVGHGQTAVNADPAPGSYTSFVGTYSTVSSSSGSLNFFIAGKTLVDNNGGVNSGTSNYLLLAKSKTNLGTFAPTNLIVVQKPGTSGSNSRYYIFYAESYYDGSANSKVGYVEVDQAGNYQSHNASWVDLGISGTSPVVGFSSLRDGNDAILLIHMDNGKIARLKVTSSGPQTVSIASPSTSLTPASSVNVNGTADELFALKTSLDNSFIGYANQVNKTPGTNAGVFRFNAAGTTSSSTYPAMITFSDEPNVKAIEFSPNSKYVYIATSSKIWRYTLVWDEPTTSLTFSGKTEIGSSVSGVTSMQLASNGHIYFVKNGTSKLYAIINADGVTSGGLPTTPSIVEQNFTGGANSTFSQLPHRFVSAPILATPTLGKKITTGTCNEELFVYYNGQTSQTFRKGDVVFVWEIKNGSNWDYVAQTGTGSYVPTSAGEYRVKIRSYNGQEMTTGSVIPKFISLKLSEKVSGNWILRDNPLWIACNNSEIKITAFGIPTNELSFTEFTWKYNGVQYSKGNGNQINPYSGLPYFENIPFKPTSGDDQGTYTIEIRQGSTLICTLTYQLRRSNITYGCRSFPNFGYRVNFNIPAELQFQQYVPIINITYDGQQYQPQTIPPFPNYFDIGSVPAPGRNITVDIHYHIPGVGITICSQTLYLPPTGSQPFKDVATLIGGGTGANGTSCSSSGQAPHDESTLTCSKGDEFLTDFHKTDQFHSVGVLTGWLPQSTTISQGDLESDDIRGLLVEYNHNAAAQINLYYGSNSYSGDEGLLLMRMDHLQKGTYNSSTWNSANSNALKWMTLVRADVDRTQDKVFVHREGSHTYVVATVYGNLQLDITGTIPNGYIKTAGQGYPIALQTSFSTTTNKANGVGACLVLKIDNTTGRIVRHTYIDKGNNGFNAKGLVFDRNNQRIIISGMSGSNPAHKHLEVNSVNVSDLSLSHTAFESDLAFGLEFKSCTRPILDNYGNIIISGAHGDHTPNTNYYNYLPTDSYYQQNLAAFNSSYFGISLVDPAYCVSQSYVQPSFLAVGWPKSDGYCINDYVLHEGKACNDPLLQWTRNHFSYTTQITNIKLNPNMTAKDLKFYNVNSNYTTDITQVKDISFDGGLKDRFLVLATGNTAGSGVIFEFDAATMLKSTRGFEWASSSYDPAYGVNQGRIPLPVGCDYPESMDAANGMVIVSGQTEANNLFVGTSTYQSAYKAGKDIFFVRMNYRNRTYSGNNINLPNYYATYYNQSPQTSVVGSHDELVAKIRFDGPYKVIMIGHTSSDKNRSSNPNLSSFKYPVFNTNNGYENSLFDISEYASYYSPAHHSTKQREFKGGDYDGFYINFALPCNDVATAPFTGSYFAGGETWVYTEGLFRQENPDQAKAIAFSATAYPNPSRGVFSLRITSQSNSATTVKVYNITGQMVAEAELVGSGETAVDLRQFPTGLFIAKIFNGSEEKTIRLVRE